jgi:hypothetical protein
MADLEKETLGTEGGWMRSVCCPPHHLGDMLPHFEAGFVLSWCVPSLSPLARAIWAMPWSNALFHSLSLSIRSPVLRPYRRGQGTGVGELGGN